MEQYSYGVSLGDGIAEIRRKKFFPMYRIFEPTCAYARWALMHHFLYVKLHFLHLSCRCLLNTISPDILLNINLLQR